MEYNTRSYVNSTMEIEENDIKNRFKNKLITYMMSISNNDKLLEVNQKYRNLMTSEVSNLEILISCGYDEDYIFKEYILK